MTSRCACSSVTVTATSTWGSHVSRVTCHEVTRSRGHEAHLHQEHDLAGGEAPAGVGQVVQHLVREAAEVTRGQARSRHVSADLSVRGTWSWVRARLRVVARKPSSSTAPATAVLPGSGGMEVAEAAV